VARTHPMDQFEGCLCCADQHEIFHPRLELRGRLGVDRMPDVVRGFFCQAEPTREDGIELGYEFVTDVEEAGSWRSQEPLVATGCQKVDSRAPYVECDRAHLLRTIDGEVGSVPVSDLGYAPEVVPVAVPARDGTQED